MSKIEQSPEERKYTAIQLRKSELRKLIGTKEFSCRLTAKKDRAIIRRIIKQL